MPAPEHEHTSAAERLFFALWPDEALRQQLRQRCKPLLDLPGGRPVATENLHITLAFLGRVDARQRTCVEVMADAIHCPAFSLQLDRVGFWPRPRVLWLAPTSMPEALLTLAADLHHGAEACGLTLDARPYQAHVTIKRKVREAPPEDMPIEPIRWLVREFVLVRSSSAPQGVIYEPLKRWALADR